MESLNQRYVADAVLEASKVTQEHALFGGKRLWKKLQTGSISKKKWLQRRNSTLYSRGATVSLMRSPLKQKTPSGSRPEGVCIFNIRQ